MPGWISQQTIEQVRQASDIVEVIGNVLPLKRVGANFKAICPFHKEKTPSFHVNPGRQIFHCFGCHKGGDVFGFIREYEGLSFMEAVQRLAERARIPIETDDSPEASRRIGEKELLLKIHEQIARRWHKNLLNSPAAAAARAYLEKRGLSEKPVKEFQLGYSLDAWDDLIQWAKSQGHELETMEKAGLILRREESSGYYDRFRGRLMFPIWDEQGRVIGFSGRTLKPDDKSAKYINSPETPLFHKSRVIYALNKARRPMLDTRFAIVCEGQIDAIACHSAGIENVVAPQGTALTSDQTRILKRYVDEVVLCFDADAAGQKAAVRALDDLLASGLSIRVALIPAPHDPDSFIRERGVEAFGQLIQTAAGFFDFYLDRLCETHDPKTDKGKTAIVQSMGQAAHKTGNSVLIDTYAQKTGNRLAVGADSVRVEFKKAARGIRDFKSGPEDAATSEESPKNTARPAPQEFWLLKLFLSNDELIEWGMEHIHPGWIRHEGVKQIIQQSVQLQAVRAWTGVASLIGALEDDALRTLVTEAVSESREIPDPEKQIRDCVTTLRNKHLDECMLGCRQKMKQTENWEEQQKYNQEVILLQRMKSAPLQAIADSSS